MKLQAASNIRSNRHDHCTKPPRGKPSETFQVGEKLLVCRGSAFRTTVKRLSSNLKYSGPCTVRNADHPRYELYSQQHLLLRRPIHTRRLVRYYQHPDYSVELREYLELERLFSIALEFVHRT